MVAEKQMALGGSILLLHGQSILCWSNGTMTETARMETFLTTQHYEAANSFGGAAKSVQRARYTAGRLKHSSEPQAKSQQDALVVLGTSFVSVTLWKLSVLILLLKRSVHLRTQHVRKKFNVDARRL